MAFLRDLEGRSFAIMSRVTRDVALIETHRSE